MRQTAGVAIFAFVGWVALVFLHAFFDAYTPRRHVVGPGDEDVVHEASVPTRLATVLPVLRGVVLGAVLGLTILIVLSTLMLMTLEWLRRRAERMRGARS